MVSARSLICSVLLTLGCGGGTSDAGRAGSEKAQEVTGGAGSILASTSSVTSNSTSFRPANGGSSGASQALPSASTPREGGSSGQTQGLPPSTGQGGVSLAIAAGGHTASSQSVAPTVGGVGVGVGGSVASSGSIAAGFAGAGADQPNPLYVEVPISSPCTREGLRACALEDEKTGLICNANGKWVIDQKCTQSAPCSSRNDEFLGLCRYQDCPSRKEQWHCADESSDDGWGVLLRCNPRGFIIERRLCLTRVCENAACDDTMIWNCNNMGNVVHNGWYFCGEGCEASNESINLCKFDTRANQYVMEIPSFPVVDVNKVVIFGSSHWAQVPECPEIRHLTVAVQGDEWAMWVPEPYRLLEAKKVSDVCAKASSAAHCVDNRDSSVQGDNAIEIITTEANGPDFLAETFDPQSYGQLPPEFCTSPAWQ